MNDTEQAFAATLRQHGHSLTKPRRVVFAAMQDQEPMTMRQVIERCSSIVDRSSIYRTVALFEQCGIVQRLQMGWKYTLELTDTFHHHHHHLTCHNCGRVIPLPENEALEQSLEQLALAHDFVMQRHQLEIQGLCRNCR